MTAPAVHDRASLDALGHAHGLVLGVTRPAIRPADAAAFRAWLAAGRHGPLVGVTQHQALRLDPTLFVPGTLSVISARLPCWHRAAAPAHDVLRDGRLGYVARHALGRDYHKVLRRRLARIAETLGPIARACTDSAPVLEKPLARDAGLGWIGKHGNLLTRTGSAFLLGEIMTARTYAPDAAISAHCGSCTACLRACPTQAIVAPYVVDAARCISTLTIESRAPIPEALRPLIGNRIFGCDDCQLACPWNRPDRAATGDNAFAPRRGLDAPRLADLARWTEADYLEHTEGMALRRIGYAGFMRNVAVSLGNGPADADARAAARSLAGHREPLVAEHGAWAVRRLHADTPD